MSSHTNNEPIIVVETTGPTEIITQVETGGNTTRTTSTVEIRVSSPERSDATAQASIENCSTIPPLIASPGTTVIHNYPNVANDTSRPQTYVIGGGASFSPRRKLTTSQDSTTDSSSLPTTTTMATSHSAPEIPVIPDPDDVRRSSLPTTTSSSSSTQSSNTSKLRHPPPQAPRVPPVNIEKIFENRRNSVPLRSAQTGNIEPRATSSNGSPRHGSYPGAHGGTFSPRSAISATSSTRLNSGRTLLESLTRLTDPDPTRKMLEDDLSSYASGSHQGYPDKRSSTEHYIVSTNRSDGTESCVDSQYTATSSPTVAVDTLVLQKLKTSSSSDQEEEETSEDSSSMDDGDDDDERLPARAPPPLPPRGSSSSSSSSHGRIAKERKPVLVPPVKINKSQSSSAQSTPPTSSMDSTEPGVTEALHARSRLANISRHIAPQPPPPQPVINPKTHESIAVDYEDYPPSEDEVAHNDNGSHIEVASTVETCRTLEESPEKVKRQEEQVYVYPNDDEIIPNPKEDQNEQDIRTEKFQQELQQEEERKTQPVTTVSGDESKDPHTDNDENETLPHIHKSTTRRDTEMDPNVSDNEEAAAEPTETRSVGERSSQGEVPPSEGGLSQAEAEHFVQMPDPDSPSEVTTPTNFQLSPSAENSHKQRTNKTFTYLEHNPDSDNEQSPISTPAFTVQHTTTVNIKLPIPSEPTDDNTSTKDSNSSDEYSTTATSITTQPQQGGTTAMFYTRDGKPTKQYNSSDEESREEGWSTNKQLRRRGSFDNSPTSMETTTVDGASPSSATRTEYTSLSPDPPEVGSVESEEKSQHSAQYPTMAYGTPQEETNGSSQDVVTPRKDEDTKEKPGLDADDIENLDQLKESLMCSKRTVPYAQPANNPNISARQSPAQATDTSTAPQHIESQPGSSCSSVTGEYEANYPPNVCTTPNHVDGSVNGSTTNNSHSDVDTDYEAMLDVTPIMVGSPNDKHVLTQGHPPDIALQTYHQAVVSHADIETTDHLHYNGNTLVESSVRLTNISDGKVLIESHTLIDTSPLALNQGMSDALPTKGTISPTASLPGHDLGEETSAFMPNGIPNDVFSNHKPSPVPSTDDHAGESSYDSSYTESSAQYHTHDGTSSPHEKPSTPIPTEGTTKDTSTPQPSSSTPLPHTDATTSTPPPMPAQATWKKTDSTPRPSHTSQPDTPKRNRQPVAVSPVRILPPASTNFVPTQPKSNHVRDDRKKSPTAPTPPSPGRREQPTADFVHPHKPEDVHTAKRRTSNASTTSSGGLQTATTPLSAYSNSSTSSIERAQQARPPNTELTHVTAASMPKITTGQLVIDSTNPIQVAVEDPQNPDQPRVVPMYMVYASSSTEVSSGSQGARGIITKQSMAITTTDGNTSNSSIGQMIHTPPKIAKVEKEKKHKRKHRKKEEKKEKEKPHTVSVEMQTQTDPVPQKAKRKQQQATFTQLASTPKASHTPTQQTPPTTTIDTQTQTPPKPKFHRRPKEPSEPPPQPHSGPCTAEFQPIRRKQDSQPPPTHNQITNPQPVSSPQYHPSAVSAPAPPRPMETPTTQPPESEGDPLQSPRTPRTPRGACTNVPPTAKTTPVWWRNYIPEPAIPQADDEEPENDSGGVSDGIDNFSDSGSSAEQGKPPLPAGVRRDWAAEIDAFDFTFHTVHTSPSPSGGKDATFQNLSIVRSPNHNNQQGEEEQDLNNTNDTSIPINIKPHNNNVHTSKPLYNNNDDVNTHNRSDPNTTQHNQPGPQATPIDNTTYPSSVSPPPVPTIDDPNKLDTRTLNTIDTSEPFAESAMLAGGSTTSHTMSPVAYQQSHSDFAPSAAHQHTLTNDPFGLQHHASSLSVSYNTSTGRAPQASSGANHTSLHSVFNSPPPSSSDDIDSLADADSDDGAAPARREKRHRAEVQGHRDQHRTSPETIIALSAVFRHKGVAVPIPGSPR